MDPAIDPAIDSARLRSAWRRAREDLLGRRTDSGHWVGKLSNSALSTATAISALAVFRRHGGEETDIGQRTDFDRLLHEGLAWLAQRQNSDGGWGDTDKSLSNIATTMLVRAAFHLAGVAEEHADVLRRAEAYIECQGGLTGLRRRYGKDKTFAVPILTNCALAGLADWRDVSPLPFELACFPQGVYRFLRLPVVSYAIPALVAIGQARYFHKKPRNPLSRALRAACVERSLAVVRRMQPDSGGFLEAAPLTSFVAMSLASVGRAKHPVTRDCIRFLVDSIQPDGSWPIDTNLATWNTTLAVNALAAGEGERGRQGDKETRSGGEEASRVESRGSREDGERTAESGEQAGAPQADDSSSSDVWRVESRESREAREEGESSLDSCLSTLDSLRACAEWLLACQHLQPHPYTGAAPGGWAWTDLFGGVPDVDDTSGALLALWQLGKAESRERRAESNDAAAAGVRWLLQVQNANGGWPTFCRGWGTMPFDRSATDLTAHALRALRVWRDPLREAEPTLVRRIDRAIERGFRYLARSQDADGSWTPLWFGNQWHPREENPVYGTSRVLMAYRDFGRLGAAAARRGFDYLRQSQNADGGWGGELSGESSFAPRKKRSFRGAKGDKGEAIPHAADPPVSSVEETALAVEALLAFEDRPNCRESLHRGLRWLVEAVDANRHTKCSPIGFYFAKLWYYEELYPLIFTVSALGRAARRHTPQPASLRSHPQVQLT